MQIFHSCYSGDVVSGQGSLDKETEVKQNFQKLMPIKQKSCRECPIVMIKLRSQYAFDLLIKENKGKFARKQSFVSIYFGNKFIIKVAFSIFMDT